jgi:hypothetical protein
VNRHKSYIECLKSTGIVVELGRFKAKEIHLPICKSKIKTWRREYNTERPHSSLGDLTPQEFKEQMVLTG